MEESTRTSTLLSYLISQSANVCFGLLGVKDYIIKDILSKLGFLFIS